MSRRRKQGRRFKDPIRRPIPEPKAPARTSLTPHLDTRTPTARANLLYCAQVMVEHPDEFAKITALEPADVHDIVIALGYPQLFKQYDEARRTELVKFVRIWHQAHELDSFAPHWPQIVEMTDRQVLDQIQADVASGALPLPQD